MAIDYPTTIASKNRPLSGEWLSGDNVIVKQLEQQLLLAAIDATGHGPAAHEIARKMGEHLQALSSFKDPADLICDIHALMAPCLGASVGVAIVDSVKGTVQFAGVGNISAYILSHEDFSFVSKDGVVGQQMRKSITQSKKLNAGDVIVLHSDGIKTRFYTQYEAQAIKHTAEQILDYIFNHFDKKYDDACCIVYRY